MKGRAVASIGPIRRCGAGEAARNRPTVHSGKKTPVASRLRRIGSLGSPLPRPPLTNGLPSSIDVCASLPQIDDSPAFTINSSHACLLGDGTMTARAMTLSADDEQRRLAELRRLAVMDTARSADFDALVALARAGAGAAAAAVSLVDEHRQWFKAESGLGIAESPRKGSFCAEVLASPGVMVIPDTRADPRFCDCDFAIAGEPVRAFVGVPLVGRSGLAYGSLSLFFTRPGSPDDAVLVQLGRLAVVAVSLLEHQTEGEALARSLAEAEEQRRELTLQRRRFEQSERTARLGGFEMSLSTGEILWTDEVYRIVGLPVGTPMDRTNVLDCYAAEERERVAARIGGALETCTGIDDVFHVVTPAGEDKWVHVISEIEVVDGRPRRLFGIIQDVSARHDAEELLRRAADTDQLTGLSNRNAYSAALRRRFDEEAGEAERTFGLLLVDLDHFKQINDSLGHGVGDALLGVVARRLAAAVTGLGTAYRIGGDEFAVIVEGCSDVGTLDRTALALLAAVCEPADVGAGRIVPKVTIGGGLARLDGTDRQTLCQNADFALYHAKETLRGGYVRFRADMRSSILKRIAVIADVSAALDDDRIVPHFQPIVELDGAQVVGFEALVRMRGRDGTVLPARAFQAALADPGVAWRVTGRMLEQGARVMRGWLDAGLALRHVGFNVGPADFARGGLEERILAAFEPEGVPLSHVILEITENVLMDRFGDDVAASLDGLRRRGIRVALDDFGTGYASLTQLRSFPVDIIKIDRSFVKDLLVDPASLAIVELVLGLADKLDKRVVAEGVETIEQAERLRELGCRLGQGYLFARPAPALVAAGLLRTFGGSRRTEVATPGGLEGDAPVTPSRQAAGRP